MVPGIGKAAESLFPFIQTGKPFGVLFAPADALVRADVQFDAFAPIPDAQLVTKLKEQYNLEPLKEWKANLAINKANSSLLVSTLLTEAKRCRSRKLGVWKLEQGDEFDKMAKKLIASDQCIANFVAKLDTGADDQAAKRRKLVRKASNTASGTSAPITKTAEVSYQYKKDWRSRRHSEVVHSAQGMNQHLQALLLQDTIDFDIKNSIFVTLDQAVERLDLKHRQVFQGPIETLKELATDRDK